MMTGSSLVRLLLAAPDPEATDSLLLASWSADEGCLVSTSTRPSSLFQVTRAEGTPRARQTRETRTPSLTESWDGELSASTMEGGTDIYV